MSVHSSYFLLPSHPFKHSNHACGVQFPLQVDPKHPDLANSSNQGRRHHPPRPKHDGPKWYTQEVHHGRIVRKGGDAELLRGLRIVCSLSFPPFSPSPSPSLLPSCPYLLFSSCLFPSPSLADDSSPVYTVTEAMPDIAFVKAGLSPSSARQDPVDGSRTV